MTKRRGRSLFDQLRISGCDRIPSGLSLALRTDAALFSSIIDRRLIA
jgi:hypothetical protein